MAVLVGMVADAAQARKVRCAMAKKQAIDIKKLLDLVTNLGEERDLPLSINLIFDITASDALIDYVINTFESKSELCTITSLLLKDEVPEIPTPSDLSIIVGGTSILLGDLASSSRAIGTPAVVLSACGEVAYTESATFAYSIANVDANCKHKGIYESGLLEIDLEAASPLEPLAAWILENAPAKRIAFAKHFEFMRHPLCTELIQSGAIQNGAIGVVVFVPGADMPLITLNQARVVLQIALVYGNALDRDRIKEIAAVIAGAFGFRAIARELTQLVPAIGFLVKAGVAYSATLAIGYTALDYFAGGGKVAGLSAFLKDSASSIMNATSASVSQENLTQLATRFSGLTKNEYIDEILSNFEYDKRNSQQ